MEDGANRTELCSVSGDNWSDLCLNATTTTISNYSVDCSLDINRFPPGTKFAGGDNLIAVICYSILFVVSSTANLTVFVVLFRSRRRNSHVKRLLLHLTIADLVVTLVLMPLEIAWKVLVAWNAGDAFCRIMMFFRTFGLYASSFVLVVISFDRYFAILHPLSINNASRRNRVMLIIAWVSAAICSIPQSVIFHVETHPRYPCFYQCVAFNSFANRAQELAYQFFNLAALYAVPLVCIIITYTRIFVEISKKSKESNYYKKHQDAGTIAGESHVLRRTGAEKIEKAKIKTIKIALIIVIVFILCWTPYFVMAMWYWFHKESAANVDPKIRQFLFIFAVSNTCLDPIVYGAVVLSSRNPRTKPKPLLRIPTERTTVSGAHPLL